MSPPRPERRLQAAAALAWTLALLPAVYATCRIAARLVPGLRTAFPAPLAECPSLVPLSLALAVFGCVTFVGAWHAFAARPDAVGRRLSAAVLGSTALLCAQGLLLP